jgi:hypothetical protein
MSDDMKLKFEIGLRELISMCVEAGMAPHDMTEALERELKWSRYPWAENTPFVVKTPQTDR